MKVASRISLRNHLSAELQKVAFENGTCHYGDYEKWCLSGKDVEQAIKNLFLEDGIFKPTKDLIHCNECRMSEVCPDRLLWCNQHERLTKPNDFCGYAQREE